MSFGIPTTYAGVNFRSRAEARWAAFFDRIREVRLADEWHHASWAKWLYEPVDLDGYIPDFVLPCGRQEVFVEVKGGIAGPNGLRSVSESIHSRVDLLLAAAPYPTGEDRGDVFHIGSSRYARGWRHALIGECRANCRMALVSWGGSTEDCCMHCGSEDVSLYLPGKLDASDLQLIFREACNATQWRGR